MKYGHKIAEDIYGNPIHVGDLVDELYLSGKSSIVTHIAIGITDGGSIRTIGTGWYNSAYIVQPDGKIIPENHAASLPVKPLPNRLFNGHFRAHAALLTPEVKPQSAFEIYFKCPPQERERMYYKIIVRHLTPAQRKSFKLEVDLG